MDLASAHGRLSPVTSDFIARPHRLLIDGKWVEPSSGKRFPVLDPATGQQIASVAEGNATDIDLAVAAARRAFEAGPWSRLKPTERGKLVWKLGDVLEAHSEELAELESLDNGKPITDARAVDLPFGCELLRYMGGWSTKICGQQIPISAPGEWHAYSIREPVGVVGQIIPWNFPLLMAVWKIAPALAAGCTIVLKPAEQTPLSALRLGELILEAGFPPGVVNIVTGDHVPGAALAAHPDVDKVAFTGSTEVGKLIVQAAAGNLKKVSLELGGKSPAIVFPDADLSVAIPGAANGIFFNMGQCCTAGSRLFVHEKVFDRMMTGLADEATKLKIGPGLDPETRIGPLVSEEQLNRVTGFLASGREQGAEVVTGGKRHGNAGYFVEPTILTRTTPEMKVVREEIFGPVVCAIRYGDDDLDRIAKQGNATEYGLAASIWTRDIGVAHKLARKLRAGSVWINVHNFNDVALPFGGYKQSGWGREMGYEAIELYTETKAVAALL
ncbi:aldehyde dehydrogenase family protein [Siccirubricoccus phaeus]|uniref:aldehyde dehydrogenase family protein n=1 Tax=Siccirubricoccus phaeus TaxID=2595053 RepID=UPI0011F146C9|nr:aldehyde dehydrogenase family protein [Siccirubricoccus phaeus]